MLAGSLDGWMSSHGRLTLAVGPLRFLSLSLSQIREAVRDCIKGAGGHSHILNLGHGGAPPRVETVAEPPFVSVKTAANPFHIIIIIIMRCRVYLLSRVLPFKSRHGGTAFFCCFRP